MKIETEAMRIWDIFGYELDDNDFFGFEIPEIQRDYSWEIGKEGDASKSDDSYRLIRDLLDFHDRDVKKNDNYFLGTLILFNMNKKKNNRLQIMDGQQRMTSLIALFSTIRYIILKSKCKKLELKNEDGSEVGDSTYFAKQIKNDFLVDKKGRTSLLPKQKATQITLTELSKIGGHHDIRNYLTQGDGPRSSRLGIKGNHLYLTSVLYHDVLMEHFRLEDSIESDHLVSKLLQFVETLRQRVVLNRTITNDIGLAYRMFVTANTRGKDLSHFDIFRGLVIARSYELNISETQIKKLTHSLEATAGYHRGFLAAETKTNQSGFSALVNKIMKESISIMHGKTISGGNVSRYLQHRVENCNNFEDLEEITKFVFQYSLYYLLPKEKHMIDNHIFSPRYISYSRIEYLGITQFYPIYVMMEKKYWTESEKAHLMWIFECLILRLLICNGEDVLTKQMNKYWSEFANYIHQADIGQAESTISKIRKVCIDKLLPKNQQGIESIEEKRFTPFKVNNKKIEVFLSMALDQKSFSFAIKKDKPHCHPLLPFYDKKHKRNGWKYHKDEVEDHGLFSSRVGNFFLCNGTQKLITDTENTPETRIPKFLEYGRNETVQSMQKISGNEWKYVDIKDRTLELIKKVEKLYPENLQPPESKKNDFLQEPTKTY
jgi:hypothetical protein